MEIKECNLSDIVKVFFDSNTIKIPKERAKISSTDLLKKEMLQLVRKKFNVPDYSNFATQDFIIEKIRGHYKQDIQKRDAICKDLINLCGLETKTERKTIINIAFALGLSESECDALLQAGGFSKLHYGGDYIETAIYLCLKKSCSYFDCKEIIADYNSMLSKEDTLSNNFSITPTIYSQVTTFFREKFDKQWQDFFNKHKGSKNQLKKQIKEKIKAQMIDLSKNSASFNRGLHKYLQGILGKWNSVTVKDFCYFYGGSSGSVSNLFTNIKKLKVKPTRDFVCLVLIIMYCKYHYTKMSIEEYIGNNLVFGYDEHLDENRPVDRFILELSKYDIDSSKIGRSRTADYITYDGTPVFINRNTGDFPKKLSYSVLMGYIISQYIYNNDNNLKDNNNGQHFIYRFAKLQDQKDILNDF